jgi:large subunit ribosomal protein L16
MNFIPKKSKYKKQFKGKIKNQIYKNINSNSLFVGTLGLKAVEYGLLNSKHFETIKQSIKKIIKKAGRVLFFNFPQISKTKKPLSMRMGKGKGNIDHWVCKIQPGTVICEINISNTSLGIKALAISKFKLPIKTKIISDK